MKRLERSYTDFHNKAVFFLVVLYNNKKSFDNAKVINKKEILKELFIYKDGITNIILIDLKNKRKVVIIEIK